MDPNNLFNILSEETYLDVSMDFDTGEILISEPWNGRVLYQLGYRTDIDDLACTMAKYMERLYLNSKMPDKEKYSRLVGIRKIASGLKSVKSEKVALQIERIETFFSARTSQQEKFIEACKEGDLKTVQKLIDAGFGINFPDSEGMTPLMWAAGYDHLAIVQELLKRGVDIHAKATNDISALMFAAAEGHTDILKVLIKDGADVNAKDKEGKTAWIYALEEGHTKALEAIQEWINPYDDSGDTPLISFIRNGNLDAAENMISAKADINRTNKEGDTPLAVTVKCNNASAFKRLLERGADINAIGQDGKPAWILAIEMGHLHLIKEVGELIDRKGKDGNTPLLYALKNGHFEAAKSLVKIGAELNEEIANHETAWIYAAKHGLIPLLNEAGADINGRYHGYGDTPLCTAVQFSDAATVEELIKNGAKVNIKGGSSAPLILATTLERVDVVQVLINHGADIGPINEKNYSALTIAMAKGFSQIEKLLKDSNKDPIAIGRDKEFIRAKSLGLSTETTGEHSLQTQEKDFGPFELDYFEGSHYWPRKMSKATKLLSSRHGELFSAQESQALQELYQSALIYDPQVVVDQVNRAPTLPLSGWRDHAITFLLYEDHFIICNRIKTARKPIEIYKYDKKEFSKEIVERIFEVRSSGKEDYMKLLEELHNKLNFQQTSFEKEIESSCKLTHQETNNCTWISSETAALAFLIMKALYEQNPSEKAISSIVDTQAEKFNIWLAFNQLYNLERYLGVRVIRPADDKKKVKKSAASRTLFKQNDNLVSSALNKIHQQILSINSEENRGILLSDLQAILNSSKK